MTSFYAIYNIRDEQAADIVRAVQLGLQRCRSIYMENGTEEDHPWVFGEGATLLKALATAREPATSLDVMNVMRFIYMRGARDVAISAAGYSDDIMRLWDAMVVEFVTMMPNQVDMDRVPLQKRELDRFEEEFANDGPMRWLSGSRYSI